ncbi:MAG: ribonuclease Z [Oscillospiraceae bacterium]|nr:ribonuclease Z [Oscillospiraceae bacterium]
MIDVCLAGTGGMLPLPDRWLTCFWLEFGGKAALIDCGEGTQITLAKEGCKLSRLDALFITHTHADHISGLPGLLLSIGNCGRTEPLTIYGFDGIGYVIDQLSCICPILPFRVEVRELSCTERSRFTWNGLEVQSLPLHHRMDCLGYSFTLHRKPVFNPQKAKALGIPVQYWKQLHAGETLTLNGMEYTQDMVTDVARKPLKLTYMTDTVYFPEMIDFAKDSDLLVCEGMYGDDDYIPKMREKGHMVFSQAAELAKESGSSRLWLTHFSPALSNPAEYTEMVQAIFPNTVVSRDGQRTTLK